MHRLDLFNKRLAIDLFKLDVVKFGAFRLKIHDEQPDAPLSPIYFNLRTANNPKPGPLNTSVLARSGIQLSKTADEQRVRFDHVAAIPNAGDPFAKAFVTGHMDTRRIEVLSMKKTLDGKGKRHITELLPGPWKSGQVVLLIDDLITKASSKLEAIRVLEDAGLIVKDVLVLIDREQGGREELARAGYKLHCVFTLSQLLNIYVHDKLITPEKRDEVRAYIKANS